MNKFIYLVIIGIFSISQSVSANNCADVLKLSVVTKESIQSEESFKKDAANFCRAYSKSSGSSKSGGGTVGYGGFTLGASSAKSNAESIAERLCKSHEKSELQDNAYRTYLRTIAPSAYSSYDHCINSSRELQVNLLGGTEKYASIRVAFNAASSGTKAGVVVDATDSINCAWKSSEHTIDQKLPLENGQAKTLKCSRDDSSEEGFITIVDELSARKDAYLSIPWGAYKDGLPVSLISNYNNIVQELDNLKSSLSGAVVAFNLTECPGGWSEYVKAYGRFIRGIDNSDSPIDPDGKRNIGHTQEDMLASHEHKVQVAYGAGGHPAAWSMTHNNPTSGHEYSKMAKEGGKETRPKNVSLLYCVKK